MELAKDDGSFVSLGMGLRVRSEAGELVLGQPDVWLRLVVDIAALKALLDVRHLA